MIGVFDSGVGGLNSFSELRRYLPLADIVYLADRQNAPYGTKTEDELIRLVKKDIQRLRSFGADKILIACCTASTVFPYLDANERDGVMPIITPTAHAAAVLSEKIAVIATEHTTASGAFGNEIRAISKNATVTEISAQELVSLVESGERDDRLTERGERYLDTLSETIKASGADSLIYGCTHFSHIQRELSKRLPKVKSLLPSKIGAHSFLALCSDEHGSGRSIYTE